MKVRKAEGSKDGWCNCCYWRRAGWPEWSIKDKCPKDEDYERSKKGVK